MENRDKYSAQNKYAAKYKKQIKMDCFTSTEQDILDRLDEVPSKASYIKDLIRRDIAWYAGDTQTDLRAYPAIFEQEDNGYSVSFPDLEGCVTCGDDIADALYMAQDVLLLVLHDMEKEGTPFPAPSDIYDVKQPDKGFVSMVFADLNTGRNWDKWYTGPRKEEEK